MNTIPLNRFALNHGTDQMTAKRHLERAIRSCRITEGVDYTTRHTLHTIRYELTDKGVVKLAGIIATRKGRLTYA